MSKKVPGLPAPAFLNRESEDFIGFQKTLELFKPLSVFAKKEFSRLRALSAEELKENFEFLHKVEKCGGKRQRIEKILEDFHEISASLEAIGNLKATSVDLFEVKRFIHHHRLLIQATSCLEDYFEALDDLWEMLSPEGSASYAFSPSNDEIKARIRECSALQRKISSLYEKQAKKVEENYGVKLNGRKFVLERRKSALLLSSELLMVEKEGLRTYTFVLRPTSEISELEDKLVTAEEALKKAQDLEVKRLTKLFSEHVERINKEIEKIVKLDIAMAKLRALDLSWTYPCFGERIELRKAFHPTIKAEVEGSGFKYAELNGEFHQGLTMIFGPNMGGKTTVLKTIGLVCALAMYGFLVPVEYALLPIVRWVRYVGSEEGKDGLSKFAQQMSNMKEALTLKGRGVLLADEFGSGTNPYEGEALATALAEYLKDRQTFSVMVTHYREAIESVDCRKYTMGRLRFDGNIALENIFALVDHTLRAGMDVKMGDAIKLAEIIGIPEHIYLRAKEILRS